MEMGRGMWGKKCGARRVCVMAVKVLQHALHVFSLSAAYQTHSLVKVLACLPWCTVYTIFANDSLLMPRTCLALRGISITLV